MEQNRLINTTDEWENIINENAAQKAQEWKIFYKIERERRLKKLWLTACGIATIGITFLILGITGAVADWLTALISVASVTTGSFVFGRYVEAKKG